MRYKTTELRTIGNTEINSVLARELHSQLDVKKDFTDWIKDKIHQCMLEENADYMVVWSDHKKGDAFLSETEMLNIAKTKQKASALGWKSDYILTVRSAKEISMVTGGVKGKASRKYFLDLEEATTGTLGVSKLNHEITLLEIAEDAARQNVINKKIETAKVLQSMGINFDPVALSTGEFKRVLPQDIGNVLGEAITEIRNDVRAYSATYLINKYDVSVKTPDWNNYLIELDYMEAYAHNGKTHKKFVDRTNYYGYNKFASSIKELPFNVVYYEDKFLDLVQLLRNEGYID